MTIIKTNRDVAQACDALADQCEHMAQALDACGGPPPLRRRPAGFDTLARILMGQQLSVASASAIWGRLEAGLGEVTPDAVLATTDETLRSYGLSGPKQRYLRASAQAVTDGLLDFKKLSRMGDADAHEHLIAVKGIGPWTADIYLLSGLGRPDVFPAGDIALQAAAQRLMRKRKRPDADGITKIAKRWQPHRSVAARVLWAYYAVPPV